VYYYYDHSNTYPYQIHVHAIGTKFIGLYSQTEWDALGISEDLVEDLP